MELKKRGSGVPHDSEKIDLALLTSQGNEMPNPLADDSSVSVTFIRLRAEGKKCANLVKSRLEVNNFR